ncbi:MAG: XRE family transcriptional regulator [Cellvibrio sp.]
MIKERLITILKIEELKNPQLEELTGISRYTWQNIRNKPEREIKEEEINAVADLFKEYRYWLISGDELPEAGQISPMTKAAQRELGTQRKA